MNMAPTAEQATIAYPSHLSEWDQVFEMLMAECSRIQKRFLELVENSYEGHPKASRINFNSHWIVEEVVANLVWHDLLNIHGDRTAFVEQAKICPVAKAQLDSLLSDAKGRKSAAEIQVNSTFVRLVVQLSHPFARFEQIMAEAVKFDHLEATSGRGLGVAVQLGWQINYQPDTQTLTCHWDVPQDDEE